MQQPAARLASACRSATVPFGPRPLSMYSRPSPSRSCSSPPFGRTATPSGVALELERQLRTAHELVAGVELVLAGRRGRRCPPRRRPCASCRGFQADQFSRQLRAAVAPAAPSSSAVSAAAQTRDAGQRRRTRTRSGCGTATARRAPAALGGGRGRPPRARAGAPRAGVRRRPAGRRGGRDQIAGHVASSRTSMSGLRRPTPSSSDVTSSPYSSPCCDQLVGHALGRLAVLERSVW